MWRTLKCLFFALFIGLSSCDSLKYEDLEPLILYTVSETSGELAAEYIVESSNTTDELIINAADIIMVADSLYDFINGEPITYVDETLDKLLNESNPNAGQLRAGIHSLINQYADSTNLSDNERELVLAVAAGLEAAGINFLPPSK